MDTPKGYARAIVLGACWRNLSNTHADTFGCWCTMNFYSVSLQQLKYIAISSVLDKPGSFSSNITSHPMKVKKVTKHYDFTSGHHSFKKGWSC